MPRVDDTLDALKDVKYMTTLDLASGYWTVPIKESDKAKTAFITHHGLFEYNVMPYGLCNAPAIFSRLMDAVLAGLKWQCVLVFIDDILVYSTSFEQHLVDIVKVFHRLRKANLTMKPSKCHFCRPKLQYLGHEISTNGIKPDPSKVQALNAFEFTEKDKTGLPKKTVIKKLQSFLGLAQYYRRFIKNYASIAKPLTELTRDSVKWAWTAKTQHAFEKIKEKLCSAPILSYPDFNQPFILQTDAAKDGLGAVLCQRSPSTATSPAREAVIAYASRSLTDAEAKWIGGVKEWEALAIVWACELFKHYLIGRKFVVQTDHSNLQWLLQQKNGRLERWAMRLLEFDFLLQYRPGNSNANADALSRHPWTGKPQELPHSGAGPLLAHLSDSQALTTAQWQDPELSSILYALGASPPPFVVTSAVNPDPQVNPGHESTPTILDSAVTPKRTDTQLATSSTANRVTSLHLYEVQNTQLCFKGVASSKRPKSRKNIRDSSPKKSLRPVIPVALRSSLLELTHNHPLGGHLGFSKVYAKIAAAYYWPGMYADIKRYCQGCLSCALRKAVQHTRVMGRHFTPVSAPFERISIDIVGAQAYKKTASGNTCILTIIDHFTSWVEAIPLPDSTGPVVADALWTALICRHGVPKYILSDQGSNFTGKVITHLNKRLGTKSIFTSPYHPQGNGKVERFHRTLNNSLSLLVNKSHSNWDKHVDSVLFAYRTAILDFVNDSPFFLVYGRDPRLPTECWTSPSEQANEISNERLTKANRFVSLSNARISLAKLVNENKEKSLAKFNETRRPSLFWPGDLVVVWRPPRHKKTQTVDSTRKLNLRSVQ